MATAQASTTAKWAGSLGPSPAGPIDEAEAATLRKAPADPLPRAVQVLRFSQRREALKDKARLNQRRIDEMFNTYARSEQQAALPAGIDELTLGKVRALFAEPAARHTAESVAQKMGLSRTTARRYLEFCTAAQQLRAEIIYGKVGRPQRIYRADEPH